MKRAVVVVVIVFCVVAVGVVGWGVAGVEGVLAGAGTNDDEVSADDARAAVRDEFFADVDALAGVSAFARTDGADAGAVLNARVPWRAGGNDVRPLVLPKKIDDVVKDNNKWLSLIEDPVLDAVDTSLLVGLSSYSKWDVFHNLPADVPPGNSLYDAPLPAYLPLRHLARVHLLKALKPGASPSFAEAAHDVEALAHLLTTSSLLSGVVATVLWKDVVAAHDRAVDNGVVGDHVVVVDVDSAERLRRVLLTAPAFVGFRKDDADTARVLQSKSVALCSTWNEVLMRDELVGPFLDDEQRGRAAWNVEASLGGCALAPVTSSPGTPSMCSPDLGASCARQVAIVAAIPPLRQAMLTRLLQFVSLNYRDSYPVKKK